MGFSINDKHVEDMIREVKKLMGAKSKTEVLRKVLIWKIQELERKGEPAHPQS